MQLKFHHKKVYKYGVNNILWWKYEVIDFLENMLSINKLIFILFTIHWRSFKYKNSLSLVWFKVTTYSNKCRFIPLLKYTCPLFTQHVQSSRIISTTLHNGKEVIIAEGKWCIAVKKRIMHCVVYRILGIIYVWWPQ